ncbi:MAG: leucine-rich repeat protein [Prevotellaceae bacterium]|nr:leucine-rich repeat protein [Prevotellaceae bacterium]
MKTYQILFALYAFLHISAIAVAETHNGTCGEKATWAFDDETGALTISGSGNMANYSFGSQGNAPWIEYRREITSVDIADGITSIGDVAFYNCSNLTHISVPNSVTAIGTNAFCGCGNLTFIALPNSIKQIGTYAFYFCTRLTSVNIPEGIAVIDTCTFSNCTALTSVAIPSSVSEIKEGAFYACSTLTTTEIPSSVNVIERNAFHGCKGLRSVVIGSGVKAIGDNAFSSCPALKQVYVSWEKPIKVGANVFENENGNIPAVLFVPTGKTDEYKSADIWPNFSGIQEWKDVAEIVATGIQLNATEKAIKLGYHTQLKATLLPADYYPIVTWSTSNANVATVSGNGYVTAVSTGEAIITASTSNGLVATCRIRVSDNKKGQTSNDIRLKAAPIDRLIYKTFGRMR